MCNDVFVYIMLFLGIKKSAGLSLRIGRFDGTFSARDFFIASSLILINEAIVL